VVEAVALMGDRAADNSGDVSCADAAGNGVDACGVAVGNWRSASGPVVPLSLVSESESESHHSATIEASEFGRIVQFDLESRSEDAAWNGGGTSYNSVSFGGHEHWRAHWESVRPGV